MTTQTALDEKLLLLDIRGELDPEEAPEQYAAGPIPNPTVPACELLQRGINSASNAV